jgi:hypothetical protein
MKKKLVVVLLALLVLSGLLVAFVPWSSFGPPRVPHSIIQRSDCTSCHGLSGVKPYPTWHAKSQLGNDGCLRCHKIEG